MGLRVDRQKKVVYLSQVFKFDQKHFAYIFEYLTRFPIINPSIKTFVLSKRARIFSRK